jgi:transposase
MGLSRRKFTKEMKTGCGSAAGERLVGAEVARAFEVNPNVLHRWRKEFREGPGQCLSWSGKAALG